MKILSCLILLVLVLSVTACNEQSKSSDSSNVPIVGSGSVPATRGIGVIQPASGINANGVVEVIVVEGITTVKTQLNIEPEQEMYYQAWLTNESQSEWITAGALRNRSNDVRHSSTYETSQDLREFSRLVVTKQAVGTESRDSIVATATIEQR